MVGRPSAVLESGARRRVVNNRNDLVGRYPYVKGVKTGRTREAGYVLVGAASNAAGARVISVVMGTPSESARDATSLALLQYGLKQFERRKVLDADTPVASAKVEYRDERTQAGAAQRPAGAGPARREGAHPRGRARRAGETPAGRRVGTHRRVASGQGHRPRAAGHRRRGAGRRARCGGWSDALGGVVPLVLILVLISVIVMVAVRQRSRRRERERAERRRARNRARARAEGQIE